METKVIEGKDKSKIFFLLSFFFTNKPDVDFVKKLKLITELPHTLSNFMNYINEIKNISNNRLSKELSLEFTKIFRGVKRGYSLPPPYESIWRGEERVYRNFTIDVIKKYRKYNLNFNLNGEPPDHIGNELKAMGFLSFYKIKDIKYLSFEKEFLKENVLKWIPEYCKELENFTENPFYKNLGRMTNLFLEEISYEA